MKILVMYTEADKPTMKHFFAFKYGLLYQVAPSQAQGRDEIVSTWTEQIEEDDKYGGKSL